jgi:hypothetical protein
MHFILHLRKQQGRGSGADIAFHLRISSLQAASGFACSVASLSIFPYHYITTSVAKSLQTANSIEVRFPHAFSWGPGLQTHSQSV